MFFQGFAENLKVCKTAAEENAAIQVQFSGKERGSPADGIDDAQSDIALIDTGRGR